MIKGPQPFIVSEELARHLPSPVVEHHPLAGGRNSTVTRLKCADGSSLLHKVYMAARVDSLSRLQTECDALTLLRNHGITNVPAPIAADPATCAAVYQFIDGTTVAPESVSRADLDAVIQFMNQLNALGRKHPQSWATPAKEACFSLAALLDNVRNRIEQLRLSPPTSSATEAMLEFLELDIQPFINACDEGINDSERLTELPLKYRTLSPSDVGFHNCIRRPDGSLMFVDFEYFGWDDPAKTIIDFVLHPGMTLSNDLRDHFLTAAEALFSEDPTLPSRLVKLWPFYGLKWCLILLNVFLPAYREERLAKGTDVAAHEHGQLACSRAMFDTVQNRYADSTE